MDQTCTVAVVRGRGLLIDECLFSGTKDKEIKNENVVVEESCRFESKTFPEIQMTSFASGNVPGFDRARTVAVRAAKPGGIPKSRVFGRNRRNAMIGASCAMAAALVAVVMVLHCMCKRLCRGVSKVPKAFQ
jgi:hypothetical protein